MAKNYSQSIEELLLKAETIAASRNVPQDIFFTDATHVPIGPTEVATEVRMRRHQDYFRRMVLQRYRGVCLVTGLECKSLLEVAHIVPWSENKELRLVPSNGLTLNPLIHRAYDANLIGIDPYYTVHVSKELLDRSGNGELRTFLEHLDNRSLLKPAKAMPDPDCLGKHYEDFVNKRIQL